MNELLLSETLCEINEQYKAGKPISKLLKQGIKLAGLYEQELRCHRARETGLSLSTIMEKEATEALKDASTPTAENIIRFPDGGRK